MGMVSVMVNTVRMWWIKVPVADVDSSKEFCTKLGWLLDADFPFDNGFRVVQFTPPGSGCSVQFGSKITPAAPGSAQGLYLIVSDIAASRKDLVARGIEVSEVFHTGTPGAQFQIDGSGRISGPAPEHATYNSFATFRDPDADLDVRFMRRETIHTENSYKFTDQGIRRLLEEVGLEIRGTWKDSRGWYTLTLVPPVVLVTTRIIAIEKRRSLGISCHCFAGRHQSTECQTLTSGEMPY